jgi:hypothetical protein
MALNNVLIALVVFLCLFGSAMLGWRLRERLPSHHLSDESISVVKLATGLIATMAALVLGLLVSSAKTTFDRTGAEILNTAAQVVQFDRLLARYGPQTQDIRIQLKQNYAGLIQILESGDTATLMTLNSPAAVNRSEDLRRRVESLNPTGEVQSQVKARALQIMDDVSATRWLALLQATGSIPLALLIFLVVWLSIIFGTLGLFAQRNGTLLAVLIMCALSTSGAILLIEELNRPLDGMIGVSLQPLRTTLARLGE